MDLDHIRGIYDEEYAASYDSRFLTGHEWTEALSGYAVEVIRELLPPGGRWLDTGCGTGWHLAQLPDVDRCGLDASEAMLARAAEQNPGVPLVHGSFLDRRPEWEGAWDLVSNLWWSYGFVDTVAQVDEVVANLARWVSPTGSLLIHVVDSEDVARGTQLPWEDPDTPVFADSLFITAVVWSWREANGKVHENQIAPQLQGMVNMVARHFEDVEVRRWPALGPGFGRPKAVIGHRKRPAPLTAEQVGYHHPFRETFPPPDHPMERGGEPGPDQAPGASADPSPETGAPTLPAPAPPTPVAEVRLDTVPTRWILVEAARRLDPRRRASGLRRRLQRALE